MVLVLTPDTFLEAVRENMELFDLSEEDARQEALVQFQAQGADVTNIVMETSLKLISVTFSKIKELLAEKEENTDVILAQLIILNRELGKDIAVRVHAGKEGAYTLLLECLLKVKSDKKPEVVETMVALMNGYPDLLDQNGVNFIMQFLDKKNEDILILYTLRWIGISVVKAERNRVLFMKMNVGEKFRIIVHNYIHNTKIISELCRSVRKFIADDDIRVVHGNQHETARSLATELLCQNTKLLHTFAEDESTLHELLQMMACLIVRNEFCVKVFEEKGVTYILDAMVNFPDSEKINRQCFHVLKGLAGSDEVREPIIQTGAATLIVSAMNRHEKCAGLIGAACMCISALALRSPNNGKAFTAAGVPEVIVQCMSAYKNNKGIQTSACSAIRNHITRCPEVKEVYLELGVEELLNNIKEDKGNLEFEAKSVLKDLGCNVHLEEQWRGTGQQLAN